MKLNNLIKRNLFKKIKHKVWENETLRLNIFYESDMYKLQLDFLPNKNNKNVIEHITKTYLDEQGDPLNSKYQDKFNRIEEMLEPYFELNSKQSYDKAIFQMAWDYLTNCTYYARPYYDSDSKVFSFGNEFMFHREVLVIDNKVYIESGSFSLDGGTFYHDYTLDVVADTFEEAIIELYHKVYERCGDDFIDDYFYWEIIDTYNMFIKQPNGGYLFNPDGTNMYWEVDKVLDRIRKYENEIPSE